MEDLNRAVRKLNSQAAPSLKNTVTKAARDSINAVVETVTGSVSGKHSAAAKTAPRKAAAKRSSKR